MWLLVKRERGRLPQGTSNTIKYYIKFTADRLDKTIGNIDTRVVLVSGDTLTFVTELGTIAQL